MSPEECCMRTFVQRLRRHAGLVRGRSEMALPRTTKHTRSRSVCANPRAERDEGCSAVRRERFAGANGAALVGGCAAATGVGVIGQGPFAGMSAQGSRGRRQRRSPFTAGGRGPGRCLAVGCRLTRRKSVRVSPGKRPETRHVRPFGAGTSRAHVQRHRGCSPPLPFFQIEAWSHHE